MRGLAVVLVVFLVLTAGAATFLFVRSSHSNLSFEPAPSSIGASTPVTIRVKNPHGIRSLTARIEQDGKHTVVDQVAHPATRFNLARTNDVEDYTFFAGEERVPDLKEGKARVTVSVQSNDFRGITDTIDADVDVILKPPAVTTDGFQHYINQGGSEMAILTPSGSWQEAGVRVGSATFRSFPIANSL